MKKETALFIDFIKTKGLKYTPQRELILNVFLSQERHLTVEELYNIVKKKDKRIGNVTVFRTLKLLCECDLAGEVDFGDKKIRYEHKYGHEHHDHLVCIKCGNFIEAVDFNLEKLQEKLCKQFNFKSIKHRLDIFGVCSKCAKR